MTARQRTRRAARGAAMLSLLLVSTAASAHDRLAPQIGAGAVLLGHTAPASRMTLALHLPSRDPAGLAAFIARVGTQGDPLYHRYLTPAQFAARFGARTDDYDAVVAWARAAGLTVGARSAARTIIPVSGTAAAMQAALGVQFNDYRDTAGATFYAADAAPRLAPQVAGRIAGVVGLSSRTRFAALARKLPAGAATLGIGHGPGGAFAAADLRAIYDVPPQRFGPAQAMAVFEQGGFDPKDVRTYLAKNGLPSVPVLVRPVDGYDGSIDDSGVELEAVLDIDMQIAINPAARNIIVYEQGTSPFSVALVDSLSAMADDDRANSIDISYGTDEKIQGTDAIDAENTVLEQMTAQGQAVFASSGDQGAYGRSGDGTLNVSDPASQPFVTGVGGTTVFPGQHESYRAEQAWNDLGDGEGATGGGISAVWELPAWQKPGGYSVTVRNGGSTTMRNVPDVAAVGDPYTGVAVYSAINGGWVTVGGTSVSAPIWSGFYSLVNAASEGFGFGREGFANPALFGIAAFRGIVYTMYNDVYDGSNGAPPAYAQPGFFAGPGYDNTTGWASFIGSALLTDFIVPPANKQNPPPPPANLQATVTATSISLSWTGNPVDRGYAIIASVEGTTDNVPSQLAVSPSAVLTGLKPNTAYYITVYSVDHRGSTPAEPIVITTARKAPPAG